MRGIRIVVLGLVTTVVLLPSPARAASPTDELRTHVNQVLALLRNGSAGKPDLRQERRAAVRQAVEGVLDFPAMAERALGRAWSGRTVDERVEFVRLFSDLLDSIYIAEIARHGDESVSYLGESVAGDDATVETRISGKSETRVDYRMHLRDGRWRVYDVLVGGLSVVENFRSQLQRLVRDSSYAGMIEKLREATGAQASPPAAAR